MKHARFWAILALFTMAFVGCEKTDPVTNSGYYNSSIATTKAAASMQVVNATDYKVQISLDTELMCTCTANSSTNFTIRANQTNTTMYMEARFFDSKGKAIKRVYWDNAKFTPGRKYKLTITGTSASGCKVSVIE